MDRIKSHASHVALPILKLSLVVADAKLLTFKITVR
jgi:hypothetical protein